MNTALNPQNSGLGSVGKRRSRHLMLAASALALAGLLSANSARATSDSWVGTTDALWATTTNWSTNPATVPGTGDTATFNAAAGAGGATINLGTGVTINTVLFDTSAAAYTIGNAGLNAQTLNLNDSGAVTMNAAVTSNELFNATVLLGTATANAGYTFTNNSTTNGLTFAGNIQGGTGGTAGAKTLTVTGAGNTTLSGLLANGGASALALTKSGAGTLTLSGATTYTGATTVNTGGTLSLTGMLGGATTITINTGGILTESTAGTIGNNNAAVLVVAGTATLSGSNTYTGATTVNAGGVLNIQNGLGLGTTGTGTTVNSGGALQTQGNILTLVEALTLNGTGISNDGALRNISGVNVYNGALTLATASRINSDAGRLILDNTTTNGANLLTVGGAGDTALVGVVGSGLGGLTKDGAGTLALLATNTYTGVTTVSGGTILLGSAETAGTSGPLGKSAAANAGSIVFGGGTLQYSPQNTNDYSGRFATTGGQAIKIDTNSRGVTFATNIVGAGTSLTKSGFGTLTLNGAANTYDGGTTVNGGTLLAAAAGNLPTAGTLRVASGGTFSMVNSAAVTSYATNSLNLENGASLAFDWVGASADTLTSTTAATTTGVVGINLNAITTPSGTPTLLSAASGLSGASYYLANNTNYTATLTASDTTVTAGSYASGTALTNNAFWYGNAILATNTAGVDNAMALSNGTTSNWSTTSGSYTATGLVPGSTANVVFSATGASQQGNIVLGADMTVNTVTFNDTTPVTINGNNALTLMSTGTGASSAISTNQNATINAGVILGASQTWTTAAGKTLTVGGTIGNVTAGAGLTIAGAGTTQVNGSAAFSGSTTVNNGATLTFASGSKKPYLGSGNTLVVTGVVNVAGDVDVQNFGGSGLNGVVNVSSTGTLTIRSAEGNQDQNAGIGNGGYGMLNITGGTVNILASAGGPGSMNMENGGNQALLRITSGVLNAGTMMVAHNGGGSSEITITGGTYNKSTGVFNLGDRGGFTTVLNVAGGLIDNTNQQLTLGRSGGTAGSSLVVANFDAGTILTKEFTASQSGYQTIINFNGGTVKASPGISTTAFTPTPAATSSLMTYVNGAFGTFNGGIVFDTNGSNANLNSNLLAPTGNGVTSLSLNAGGSGYTGAPIVTISDTGVAVTGTSATGSSTITSISPTDIAKMFVGQTITGTGIPAGSIVTAVGTQSVNISQNATAANAGLTVKGVGATAYATVSGGSVTGFVVTNPGVGYVGTVTAALGGGFGTGGSGTAATLNAITPVANTSGGLTKNGLGTLTLSGLTTFTGATTINAGTLGFGQSITNTYGSSISGPGAVSQTGTGTTILSANNTYTGPTTISAGVLELTNANALPGGIATAGGTSDLIFSGGVLGLANGDFTRNLGAVGTGTVANFTGAGGWAAYGADRVVNIGGSLGTITWATANTGFNAQTLILSNATATNLVDLQNPINLGTATRTVQTDNGAAIVDGKISGIISGGAGGALTKTGNGTLELSANNTYIGTTTVSAGTLLLSGDNSGSASSMTVSANAIAQFNTLNSIPSTGRTVTDTGTVTFGASFGAANIPAALLRLTTASAGAVAIDNYASTNFDFNTAGLTAASLGSIGNLTYTGTVTPNVTGGYRLGGAGGTLTLGNTNALTGANALTVTGNVILAATNNNTGATTINTNGLLTLGAGLTGQNGSVGGNIVNNGTALIFNNFDNQIYAGVISGTGSLTKNGAGQLTLAAQETYTGLTTLNAGTLTLAGGNHTLAVNKTFLITGGTLDLGSTSQYVGSFTGPGGVVTGAGGTFTTNAASGTFAGAINGSLNFVKAGANTLILTAANGTTGSVSVIGGGLTLKDGGTLASLSPTNGITINNASFSIDNTGVAGSSDRVNDSAPITLNGGILTFTGRAAVPSTETLGSVTANSGYTTISVPTTTSTSVLTLTSLNRSAGALINISSGADNNMGQTGNKPALFITGDTTGMSANLAPINGVVPGAYHFLTADNSNLVGYVSGKGFGDLGQTGFGAAPVAGTATSTSTQNVTGAWTVPAGGQTVNSISSAVGMSFTIASDALVVGSGMIFANSQSGATPFGTTALRGQLTSGTSELFDVRFNGNGTPSHQVINSVIADNGGTSVKFIIAGNSTGDGRYWPVFTAQNTNSGGWVVTGVGIKLVGTTAGDVVIPAGGVTINDGAQLVESTNQGQINSSNVVTLNGGGALILHGTNTLAGLVFNSNGGTTTPSVTPYLTVAYGDGVQNPTYSGNGTLVITGDISSTPTNVAVTPIIGQASGNGVGILDLNNSTHNITVDALPQGNFVNTNTPLNGLAINSLIQNGGFTKKGTGVLNLTGANTFAGQLTIESGVLNVASVNNVSASGVLGNSSLPVILGKTGGVTGTLEVTAGTTGSKPFTMASGGTGAFQIDTSTTSLGGLIDGGGNLTKTGPGILTLTNVNNTYSGATTISAGTLKLTPGIANGNNINSTASISISGGATLDVTGLTSSTIVLNQPIKAYGTGTANITGAVNAASQTIDLQDGSNIGTLAISSGLTLNGSVLRFDLGSSNAADRIVIGGTPTLSGTQTINVAALTGLTSLAPGQYTLITAGSNLNATFSLASSSLTVGSNNYNLSLTDSTSTAEILTITPGGGSPTQLFGRNAPADPVNAHINSTIGLNGTLSNAGSSGLAVVLTSSGALSVTGLGSTSNPVVNGAPATITGTINTGATAGLHGWQVTNTDGSATNPAASIGGTVNVYAPASPNTVNGNIGNYHVGAATALSLTNGTAGAYNEDLNAGITAGTNTSVSGSVSSLLAGNTSTNLQVTLGGGSGPQTGQVTIGLTSTGTVNGVSNTLGTTPLTSQTVAISGTGYNLAGAGTHAPEPVSLGTIHIGDNFPLQPLSITNTAPTDGYSEKLNASIAPATGDVTASGSFAGLLAAGSTNNADLRVSLTNTAGSKSGSATITLTSDGTGSSGLGTTSLGTQTVNVSGAVFNGAGKWVSNSGSSWGTGPSANWADSNGVNAAPGTFAGYANTDTATFDGTGTVHLVNLDGAIPSLKALTFTGAGDTIAKGSGGNLTLNNGASAVIIDVTGSHTISAPLQGVSPVAKTGTGTLTLSGDNSGLTGGTTISNGTIQTRSLSALGPAASAAVNVVSGTLHVDVPGIHLSSLTVNGTVTTTSLAVGGAGSTGNIELGTVDGSGNTVVPGTLTLGPTGLIDLSDRMLIVHYTQSSTTPSILDGPATAIKAALVQGRNVAPGGVFDGPWTGTAGITSSRAASDFSDAHIATGSPNTEFYALGYGDSGKKTLSDSTITNKMLINDAGPSFFDPTANGGRGAGVGSTVFVRYTRVGDATMDGIVGNNDVTVLGLNFDPTYNPATNPDGPKQWYDGDFNYNGIVDNNDVTILGLQFDPTNTTGVLYSSLVSQYGSNFAAAFTQGVDMGRPSASVVPEPGVLTLLGVGALTLIRRRRA